MFLFQIVFALYFLKYLQETCRPLFFFQLSPRGIKRVKGQADFKHFPLKFTTEYKMTMETQAKKQMSLQSQGQGTETGPKLLLLAQGFPCATKMQGMLASL
jgi:hypothetical protein